GHDVLIQYEGELAKDQSFLAKVEKLLPTPQLRQVGSIISEKSSRRNEAIPQNSPPVVSRISANEKFINPKFQNEGNAQKLNLSLGKEIQARVGEVIDSKTFLIQFKGETFQVENPGNKPLIVGEPVSVRVEGASDQIRLVLFKENLGSKTVDPSMLKPYIFFKQSFAESAANLQKIIVDNPVVKSLKIPTDLLERMRENLNVLFGKSDTPPKAEIIAEMINRSGINYETKINNLFQGKGEKDTRNELRQDLKGQLLELAQELEKSSSQNSQKSSGAPFRQLTDLINQVKLATNNIELQQLTNQFAKQENNPVLIQLPNPFSPNNDSVKLYVRNDSEGKKKGSEKSAYHLTLLLDLTTLGNLRTDAKIKGTNVSVKIQVESQMVADFIGRSIPEIKNRLSEIGFTSTVSCNAREKVCQEVGVDLDRLLIDEPSRLVDIKT
ncbi:MAG: flagellar hook-length control protein FliK, partial [Nitrospinales bacterium]